MEKIGGTENFVNVRFNADKKYPTVFLRRIIIQKVI